MLMALPLFVAVLVTNAPPFALGDARPSDLGLAYEDVEVRTTDGVRLLGWYVPSSNGAAVVLRAGAGSSRTDVLDHAAVLAHGGYGVLLLEARGHGGSSGNANRWGWYGDRDIGAGVTFLQSREDVVDDRIGVVGISMGGEEAIGAAGSDERIRAVVAEGTTGRGIATEGAPSNAATGWIGRTMAWVGEQATALMTSAPIPTKLHDAVEASAPRPMLIIIAGDVAEERDAGAHFQAAAPDSVDLWIVPDSGHTEGIKTHPGEWADRVLQFLDRSL
jgi:pimeloyl-ACP methyl ester carboxylesterase